MTHNPAAEILATTAVATEFIRAHGLHLSSLEIEPSRPTSKQINLANDEWEPVKASAHVIVFSRPDEFLRWVDALQARVVMVKRRDVDTCLWLRWDHQHGAQPVTWRVAGSIRRDYDGPHLPGITVGWDRGRTGRALDTGRISDTDLRTTLAALRSKGVAFGAEATLTAAGGSR
jgi:hypothetical protein